MKKLTLSTTCIIWGLSVVVTYLPLTVTAEEAAVEEIIVTARQREELLQDVPASITAFTEADIERAGIERAEDFISLTPGVSLVDAAEVGDTQVSIRGINGSRDAEANFAFIIDGILMTNPSAFNREFANLQQIEVLKGPQGALYGRNGSAGAVIVTTKKPSNEFVAEFKGSGSHHDSYFAQGVVSGPLMPDQLFGSLEFDYRTTDGFYHNAFLDEDNVDDFEGYNVNGRMIWEPNDDLSIDTRVRYGEIDAASITYNAAFALQGFGFGAAGSFEEDVNAHDFIFLSNIDPTNDQESLEFSIKADYDMDWATATGWLLYSDIEQSFLADGTSGDFGFFQSDPACLASFAAVTGAGVTLPPPLVLGAAPGIGGGTVFGPYSPTTCDGTQFQLRNQEDISVEFRLTSPSEDRFRWQVGAYYLHLEREVGVNTALDSGGKPIEKLFVPGVTEALVHDDFTTNVYAVFANVAYDFTPTIEGAAALRYDLEDREVENLVPASARTTYINPTDTLFFGPFNGGFPLNPALVTNPTGIPDRDDSWDQIQPKISLSWDATDNLNLFTTYGIGFKSGGFNNAGSGAIVNTFINAPILASPLGAAFTPVAISDKFEKEVSHSIEVGFKSRLAGGTVNMEGAVYHTEVDDMQFFEFLVGGFGLLRVVNNINEVSITGAEFAMDVAVNDALTLFGGASILDGEIDKNTVRPYTVGNEVPYAPDYTLNLGLDFNTPFRDNINFVSRADWSFVGETWFHTVQDGDIVPNLFSTIGFPATNLSFAERDSFSTINVRVGLEGPNWAVTAFARNLLDEEYLEEVIPAPEFGGSFIHPGARRLWGFEAVYRF